MTEETRPKVLALYRAVLELLDDGADINAMKVSDITEHAGIGKGTAYDYFKSKEEIIASALSYDMERKIQTEMAHMSDKEHFFEKVHYIFDWVSEQHKEQKEKMEGCEQEWMKEFLYQSVRKSLTP